jgi:uncharacterized protein
MERNGSTFLTARWENLIMANFEVDPQILNPYLPQGTELDYFHGKCYVSLVGFLFLETKLLGLPIPLHQNFEEFNLRFYVKYGNKRGAVFIKEIVPKPAISIVANLVYHEPYIIRKMKHAITKTDTLHVKYQFLNRKKWNSIEVNAENNTLAIEQNSKEAFILEHYWGYNRFSSTKTMEYGVEHEPWVTHPILNYHLYIDIESLYGKSFVPFLQNIQPDSIFLAKGSDIIVRKGNIIT